MCIRDRYSLDEVTGVGSADKDDADGEDSGSAEEAAETLYFRAF